MVGSRGGWRSRVMGSKGWWGVKGWLGSGGEWEASSGGALRTKG